MFTRDHTWRRLRVGGLAAALVLTVAASWSAAQGATPAPKPEPADDIQPIPDEPPDEGMPPLPPEGRGHRRGGEFGPGPRPGGPRGPLPWSEMTEEQRARFREFMAEHFPARFDELSDLEDRDPKLFETFIGRMLPEMMRLRELRDRDPELFAVRKKELENEFQTRRLGRRYRMATDEATKTSLEKEIRAKVEEHFDLRTERETKELARLEKRIEQLRTRNATRQTKRSEMIDQMVEDVLAGRPPRADGDGPPDGPPDGPGHRRNRIDAPKEGAPDGDKPNRPRRARDKSKRPPAEAAPKDKSPAPPDDKESN